MDIYNASKHRIRKHIQTVPVYEKNTNVDVILRSSHPAPATLRALSWEGDYSPKIINVSDYIHPLTTEAATQVASNLRPDDRREVEEGMGYHLPPCFDVSQPILRVFTVPDGKTAGMAGVRRR